MEEKEKGKDKENEEGGEKGGKLIDRYGCFMGKLKSTELCSEQHL